MDATNPFEAETAEALAAPLNGAHFLGIEKELWRLLVRGSALLLLTLGLYRFWLVTDVRRYLWNNTEIAVDTLDYTGTAGELLVGFLIAIVLLVPIYAVFYLGALAPGAAAQAASVAAFLLLALLGHFAVYRARRYRLSRTVYRGIRFHQTGSAWRYAICASFWWSMIAITLGLAYPWAQASLERFKIRNTFYGSLQGQFVGTGAGLFFRGLALWLLVVAPLVLGLFVAVGAVDWSVIGEGLNRGMREAFRSAEAAGAAQAAAFATLAVGWSLVAAAVLYPAFQAMVLRWWISGLRFGKLTVTSRLRTSAVYGLYWRFVWISVVTGMLAAFLGFVAYAAVAALGRAKFGGVSPELVQSATFIGFYAIAALGYSAIYQATVTLRLWKNGFESLELANVEVLDKVKAVPARATAVGEGIADALHFGGI
jgi:uncharacterized membrane protein YjgN (DUF898 family)